MTWDEDEDEDDDEDDEDDEDGDSRLASLHPSGFGGVRIWDRWHVSMSHTITWPSKPPVAKTSREE